MFQTFFLENKDFSILKVFRYFLVIQKLILPVLKLTIYFSKKNQNVHSLCGRVLPNLKLNNFLPTYVIKTAI